MNVYKVKKDGIIYFEKTKEETIYVIKKGKVRLEKLEGVYLVDNQFKKTKILCSGDAFGFEEVLIGEKRGNRAIAIEDTELIIFTEDEFSNILKGDIKLGKRILKSLTNEIKKLSIKIKDISKLNEKSSKSNMKGIYLYFLKQGKFDQAKQVLNRMGNEKEYEEYTSNERHKIKKIDQIALTESKVKKIIVDYINYDKETLKCILLGLKKNIFDKKIEELIEYNLLKLLKEEDREKYLNNAIKKISNFTETKYGKKILYDIIKYYEQEGKITQALNFANKLLDQKLEKSDFEKTKKIILDLSKKVKEEEKNVSKL
ncbi:MAG: Crp/Fnr family transcriptional regulator [Fusobacteriota bacterium]